MKRFLTILLVTLALTAALCVNASASTYDNLAEELSRIGMLKGSADGFNLDQAPTRGQAAIMLVRLFGGEDRAQKTFASGRITCPFEDVNATTAPYVAWLVDEGLANGTSATTFGASEPCTAKAYTIFLLRALGYKDNSDFTTNSAQGFAANLGIIDTSAVSGTFLRDDLVAMTYQALGTTLKDGSTYLLDSLIKNEAVAIDSNAAYPITEKIEAIRAVNAASESLSKGLSASIDLSLAVTETNTPAGATRPVGQVQQTQITGKGDIKLITGRSPQMSVDLTMNVNNKSENTKVWLRDGVLYTQSGENSLKMDMPKEYLDMLSNSSTMNSGASVLPYVDTVSKSTSGSDVVYKINFNDAFGTMLNNIIAQALKESGLPEEYGSAVVLDSLATTYTLRAGALKAASVNLSMSMSMPDENNGTSNIGLSMVMDMKIAASGSAVKISFPDFSNFEEVSTVA